MTDPAPEPIVVPPSPLNQQLKAQLRIGIAAIAGALVLRHVLPAWIVNDATVDYVVGIAMLALAAIWSWIRAKIVHSRFYTLAVDPKVPNSAVRLAEPPRTGAPGDYSGTGL